MFAHEHEVFKSVGEIDSLKYFFMKSEEEIKSSNALIKLKLELEYGMKTSESSALNPEIENEWLNTVYRFEQQYKNAKNVKVYELIGSPAFKKHDKLGKEEISIELNHVLNLLAEKEIVLDCLCQYDDRIIYRFITEELFEHTVDDIQIPGMVIHFIYEEFHPNHDYDLRRYATDFIEAILSRKWDSEYDTSMLSSTVQFSGRDCDNNAISDIILAFQEAYKSFKIEKFEIEKTNFDVDKENASVQIQLVYSAQPFNGNSMLYSGKSIINFLLQWGFWRIVSFQLPGLGI